MEIRLGNSRNSTEDNAQSKHGGDGRMYSEKEVGARSHGAALVIVRIQLLLWMRWEPQEALSRGV